MPPRRTPDSSGEPAALTTHERGRRIAEMRRKRDDDVRRDMQWILLQLSCRCTRS